MIEKVVRDLIDIFFSEKCDDDVINDLGDYLTNDCPKVFEPIKLLMNIWELNQSAFFGSGELLDTIALQLEGMDEEYFKNKKIIKTDNLEEMEVYSEENGVRFYCLSCKQGHDFYVVEEGICLDDNGKKYTNCFVCGIKTEV